MNIEALLKLKCQQALAQGDYDAVSYYSQQLVYLQAGTLLGEMPIGETLKRTKKFHKLWLDGNIGYGDFEVKLLELYGPDLLQVCKDFFITFNSAELCEALSEL